ncbi:hypothetical protein CVT26_013494 [Gymnopilus dilepis]|uniref:Uncharacterized protein n=1 Tax=Gymnopilus dilepis TaxID=231916 RepID=A0A409Y5P5_9AGAR|nr:hypothetical protein CVT26_013494 [Gymnopilus dilepis]
MAQIHTVASPASNSPSTADAAQSAVADVVKPLPRDPAGDAAATASPVGADAVATPLDAGAGAVAAALQNHAHVMAAGGGLRSTYALPNGLGYMLRSGATYRMTGTDGTERIIPANGRNYSSDFIIPPSHLADPGLGRGIYISITVGRPTGIIDDIVFFFELLKLHRELSFMIFETFAEAQVHYQTHQSLGLVRLSDHLATPLTFLLAGVEANTATVPSVVATAAPPPAAAAPPPAADAPPPSAVAAPPPAAAVPPPAADAPPPPAANAPPPVADAPLIAQAAPVAPPPNPPAPIPAPTGSAVGGIENVPRNRHHFRHVVVGPRSGPASQSNNPAPAGVAPSGQATGIGAGPRTPKEVIEIFSSDEAPDDSDDSMDEEPDVVRPDDVDLEVIDDSDRPDYIPKYPRGASAPPAPAPASSKAKGTSSTKTRVTTRATARAATEVASHPPAASAPATDDNAQQIQVRRDIQGNLVINPVITAQPLGRNADPSRNMPGHLYPELVPNAASIPAHHHLVRYTPVLYPPSSSKKRVNRPADGPDDTQTAKEEDAGARKRRRDAIEAGFANKEASASSPVYGIFGPGPDPITPVASRSAAPASSAAGNEGQTAHDRFSSPTNWGFTDWTPEQLDKAGPALAPAAEISASVTQRKPRSNKGKGRATRKAD